MPTETTRKKYQKPSGAEPFTRSALNNALDRIDEYNEWLADNYSHDVILTRTDGKLTKVEEKLPTTAGTLRVQTDLTRTTGVLTSVRERVYEGDGSTLVKDATTTLVRSGGQLVRVEVRPA